MNKTNNNNKPKKGNRKQKKNNTAEYSKILSLLQQSSSKNNNQRRKKAHPGGKQQAVYSAPIATSKLNTNNYRVSSVVVHRELVTTITGGQFVTGQYRIQPGISSAFPWLSTMANMYEMYQVLSLEFQFITQSSATSSGMIYMAMDYDPSDQYTIGSTSEIMQMHGCTAQKIWADSICRLQPKLMRNPRPLYTREYGFPANTAIQDYDAAQFHYVVSGSPSVAVGALFINYRISFSIPQQIYMSAIEGQSYKVTYNNNSVGSTGQLSARLLSSEFVAYQNHSSVAGSFVQDYNNQSIDFIGEESINSLFTYTVKLFSGVTEAVVDSIATTLSQPNATNTAELFDEYTLLPTPYLTIQKSGSAAIGWAIRIAGVLATSKLAKIIKIGTGIHSTINLNQVQTLIATLLPYDIKF